MGKIESFLKSNKLPILIVIITISLRLIVVYLTQDRGIAGDEGNFVYSGAQVAKNFMSVFLQGEGKELTLWGKILMVFDIKYWTFPLPLIWVALFNLISSKPLIYLAIVQAILSGFIAYLILNLGKYFSDERIGLVAATMFAAYPLYLFYSVMAMSEYLFMLLLIPFFYFLYKYILTKNIFFAVLTGIFWGLGCMARSSLLYCFVVIPCWLLIEEPKKWKKHLIATLLILLCGIFVISPWTLRNYYQYGVFVPITTHTASHLLLHYLMDKGADPKIPLPSITAPLNDGEMYKAELKMFSDIVLNQPERVLIKIPKNFYRFFSPDYEIAFRFFTHDFGFKLPRKACYLFMYLELVIYGMIFLTALFGILWSPKNNLKSFLLIFLTLFIGIHLVGLTCGRFRMGLMFIFFIFSAWFFIHIKESKNLFKKHLIPSVIISILSISFVVHWIYFTLTLKIP